jgi:DNA topoisomerase-3
LDIAQSLYEKHKILSYPRTATRYITSSIGDQIRELFKLLSFDKFVEPIQRVISLPQLNHSRIVKDSEVKEHTAIIPTLNNDLKQIYNTLEQDEKKIFDLVVLNLIANYYNNYKYNSISIQTQVKQDMFITKGIEVLDMGWRAVYKDSGDESDNKLAGIKEGTTVKVDNPKISEVVTEPPSRYNESSLLAIMEKPIKLVAEQDLREAIKGHGIGTDATRAGIIESLVQRGYIVRKGKELISTDMGRSLIHLIDIPMLKSAKLTAEWEQQLEAIAEGEMKKDNFKKTVEAMVRSGIRGIRGE